MVLKNNIKKGFAGLGIAAILSMSLVTGVSASDATTKINDVELEVISSTIGSNGLLLETAGVTGDGFGTIELKSNPETYETGFVDKFTVTDLRGTQAGYNLQVSAGAFESAGHTLPTGSLTIDPLTNIERVGDGLGEGPVSSLTATTIIDEGSVEVLSAPAGDGAGIFDITFDSDALGLTVDATTAKIGSYETTLTWDLHATPTAE